MRKVDIAIIGAGAAGLMSAATAADGTRCKVVLLEGNQKPGKKLLATGNGRCNLSNQNLDTSHYYGDTAAVPDLLTRYGCARLCQVFAGMGLQTRVDNEGRVYPLSLQAAGVLKILSQTCNERGVDMLQEFTAFSAVKTHGGFVIKATDGRQVEAKKLILATGGKASPRHSCSTDGYKIAQQLGHSVTPMYPALTRLVVRHSFLKTLSGVRCKGEATLLGDSTVLCAEKGEVLFGDNTVSGICIFGLSIKAAEFFATGKIGSTGYSKLTLRLDLCPDLSVQALQKLLQELAVNRPALLVGECLDGFMQMKVGMEIVRCSGLDTLLPMSAVKCADLQKIAQASKAVTLPVFATGQWTDAQITAGGIPMAELDPATMQSKICPGLYIAGEMLHVHGDCGGYNLHWAFLTGILAGCSAAETTIIL